VSKRPLKSLARAVRAETIAHSIIHVAGRASSVEEHVGRDLTQEITDEQDGDTGLVLCTGEVEVLLKIIKTSESNGVAIEVVEPVHRPQHRHDPSVELLHKGDFPWVGLLVGTRVIDLRDGRYRLFRVVVIGSLLLEHDNLVVLLIVGRHGDFV
jgi:hypothetical protein